MILGGVLSGVGRFVHVGKMRDREALQQGPAGRGGTVPALGSGPPRFFRALE